MPEKETLAGHGAALFSILVWGTTFISTKVLLRAFAPVEILFLRFVLGFLALALMCPRRLKLTDRRQELTFAAASQEAETLGYILKLLEKEAARECARRVFPTLDAILDFVVGLGLMALGGLGLAAACVVAGAPDSFTRAAALLGLGFMAAVNLHRQKRK